MTDAQIKSAAAARLKAAGVDVPSGANLTALTHLIERHTGLKVRYGNNYVDFVAAYAFPPKPRPVREFREVREGDEIPMELGAHWRQADIDAAQPPVMTPRMVGNGSEHSKVWTR